MGKSAVSVTNNNYYDNPKESNISTPPGVSEYIFDSLKDQYYNGNWNILDPAIGEGALLLPWIKERPTMNYYGIDNRSSYIPGVKNYQGNYLAIEKFDKFIDLAIINPPWNHGGLDPDFVIWLKEKKMSRKLLPWEWLKKTFELFGYKTPVVLITCWGLLYNNWRTSGRPKEYEEWQKKGARCNWTTALMNDIFPNPSYNQTNLISSENQPNKEHQSLIMYWNIEPKEKDLFLPQKYIDFERPRNTSKKPDKDNR